MALDADLVIRQASLDDLETVLTFRLNMIRELRARESDLTELEAATRKYLRNALATGQYVCFIARHNDVAVASAAIFLFDRPPIGSNLSTREARLVDVYTIPEWRRRGAAEAAVSAAIVYAKQTNARRLRLGATHAARHLYEKLGFQPVTTEMELTFP